MNSKVTDVSPSGVRVGEEHLRCSTVIWGAGVQASTLGKELPAKKDGQGRIMVGPDLAIAQDRRVFVIGDQAHFRPEGSERALPGVASVAIQQGRHVARVILADAQGQPRAPFVFRDKGQMATIGRKRAVLQLGGLRTSGTVAWALWLLVHIYFLSGFRNRLFVLLHWCWSYLTFSRGARLIVEKHWHSYGAAARAPSVSLSPAPEAQRAHPGAALAANMAEPPLPASAVIPGGAALPGSIIPSSVPDPVLSQPVLSAPSSAPLQHGNPTPEEWWDEPTRWMKPEPSPRTTAVRRTA